MGSTTRTPGRLNTCEEAPDCAVKRISEQTRNGHRGGRRHLPSAGRGRTQRVPPWNARLLTNLSIQLGTRGRFTEAWAAAWRRYGGGPRQRGGPDDATRRGNPDR